MQKIDTAELRRLHEAATKGMNWQEEVAFSEACKVHLPALLDELEAARKELEALNVPLAVYERHTKLRKMLKEGLLEVEHCHKDMYYRLKKEANGTRPTNKNCT